MHFSPQQEVVNQKIVWYWWGLTFGDFFNSSVGLGSVSASQTFSILTKTRCKWDVRLLHNNISGWQIPFLPTETSCTGKTLATTAGPVEALTASAPRVLQHVRQCACACDNCDSLARRLNEKLQLGKTRIVSRYKMLHTRHTTRVFSAFFFPCTVYCIYIYTHRLYRGIWLGKLHCRERSSDASRLLLVQSSQLWDAFEPNSVDALVLDRTCLWMILDDGWLWSSDF